MSLTVIANPMAFCVLVCRLVEVKYQIDLLGNILPNIVKVSLELDKSVLSQMSNTTIRPYFPNPIFKII